MRVSLLILVVLVVGGCGTTGLGGDAGQDTLDGTEVGLDTVDPFSGSQEGVHVLGRLNVLPNPIYIHPDWPWADVHIIIESAGSEDIVVERVELEGSDAYTFSFDGSRVLELDHIVDMNSSCGAGGGTIVEVSLDREDDPGMDGLLRVVTTDPTSPSVEVPILADTTGLLEPEWYGYPSSVMAMNFDVRVRVVPNPVYFPSETAADTELITICLGFYLDLTFLNRIDVIGPGLSLLEFRDRDDHQKRIPTDPSEGYYLRGPHYLDMQFEPTREAMAGPGFVRIEYVNSWGNIVTHAIPVIPSTP